MDGPQRYEGHEILRLARCLLDTLRGCYAVSEVVRAGSLSCPAVEAAGAEADALHDDELVLLRIVCVVPLPASIAGLVAGLLLPAAADEFPAVGGHADHAALAFRPESGESGEKKIASEHSRRSFFSNCFGVGRNSNAFGVVHEDHWYGDIVLRFRGHLRSLASTWWPRDAGRSMVIGRLRQGASSLRCVYDEFAKVFHRKCRVRLNHRVSEQWRSRSQGY